jgi:hypothetical protein
MKEVIISCLLILNFIKINAQFGVLPTNSTNAHISEIMPFGNCIIISGWSSFSAKTYDGGASFVPFPLPSLPNYESKLHRVDTNLFLTSYNIAGNNLKFFFSNDTGNTWELRLDTTFFFDEQYAMFDNLEGILVGSIHEIIRTHDGGYTWQWEYFHPPSITSLKVFGDSTILMGGFEWINWSNDRYQTRKGGGFSQIWPTDFYFINKDTFFACGYDHAGGNGFLYHTFHGYDSIKIKYMNNGFTPRNMHCENANEIYLVGRNNLFQAGAVYRTMDLGNTWTIYNTGIDCDLFDIHFLNDSIALISGDHGLVLRWNKNSFATEIRNITPDKIHVDIYPNPGVDMQTIVIHSPGSDKLSINLKSLFGSQVKEVFKGEIHKGISKIKNSIADLPVGIYLYEIEFADHNKIVSKIEKQ